MSSKYRSGTGSSESLKEDNPSKSSFNCHENCLTTRIHLSGAAFKSDLNPLCELLTRLLHETLVNSP